MGEVARKHDCKIEDQPEAIFLSPPCDEYGDGRLWCDDPQEPCDECGFPWTKYVRSDIHASALAQAEKERDEARRSKNYQKDRAVIAKRSRKDMGEGLAAVIAQRDSALSQLAEARGDNAWRPIESAPHNGLPVELYRPPTGIRGVTHQCRVVAVWVPAAEDDDAGWFWPDDMMADLLDDDCGMDWYDDGRSYCVEGNGDFTHWRPARSFPSPPSEKGEE